jgi:DNA-nicking Smr family endonuclease
MSRRQPDRPADFHLWSEVAATVRPLKRARRKPPQQVPAEAAAQPPPRPRKQVVTIPMPSYRSDGQPSRPPGHGIEPGMRKRLQRGTLDIDGTIDLHGMRQAEAHAALIRFIHGSAAMGRRWVLVITGKGLPSRSRAGDDERPFGEVPRGVLKRNVPMWLAEPEVRGLIVSFTEAAVEHGGSGALYVHLRRG